MNPIKQSLLIVLFFFLSNTNVLGQKKRIEKLPDHLKEISGLVFLNDTLLVAHNDSGNDPILYFLNIHGKEIHKVKVENAKNKDWEDITSDGKGTLYIGDIGNNNNCRQDLCIYKINTKGILKKESVIAEKINFSYPDQTAFPPEEKDLHFDAEGMAFYHDSLFIFTKNRTEPTDGKSFCYSISTKSETCKATKRNDLFIGKEGWWKDAVTSVEIKNEKCYILTYNRLIIYSIKKGHLNFVKKISLTPISQYESVAVNSKGIIYVADEKNKILGGGNLYIVEENKPKKNDN